MLLEHVIWNDPVAQFIRLSGLDELVRLLPVAAPVRELQVTDVRRVSAFRHGNDVVDRRGERMRIAVGKVYRLPADPADGLGLEDFKAGGLVCSACSGGSV